MEAAEYYAKTNAQESCMLCPAPLLSDQPALDCPGCDRHVHAGCHIYVNGVQSSVQNGSKLEWQCSNCRDGKPERRSDPNRSLRTSGRRSRASRRSKPRGQTPRASAPMRHVQPTHAACRPRPVVVSVAAAASASVTTSSSLPNSSSRKRALDKADTNPLQQSTRTNTSTATSLINSNAQQNGVMPKWPTQAELINQPVQNGQNVNNVVVAEPHDGARSASLDGKETKPTALLLANAGTVERDMSIDPQSSNNLSIGAASNGKRHINKVNNNINNNNGHGRVADITTKNINSKVHSTSTANTSSLSSKVNGTGSATKAGFEGAVIVSSAHAAATNLSTSTACEIGSNKNDSRSNEEYSTSNEQDKTVSFDTGSNQAGSVNAVAPNDSLGSSQESDRGSLSSTPLVSPLGSTALHVVPPLSSVVVAGRQK